MEMKASFYTFVLLVFLSIGVSNFAFAASSIGLMPAPSRPSLEWAGDVLINEPDHNIGKPSIASAPNGDLYAVSEDLTLGWIYVYRSTNGGESWSYLTGVVGGPSGYRPSNPSITYADGEEDWVYVAYEAKQPDNSKAVEVFRFDPDDPFNSDIRTVESGINMPSSFDHIYPSICTDSSAYGDYWVYVTYHCYNQIDPGYLVRFSRSNDYGMTWSTPKTLAGVDTHTRLKPHIAFGGPLGFPGDSFRLFVVYERAEYVNTVWRNNVFVIVSRYFGNTWDAPVQLTTSSDNEYDARVAAAYGGTAVVVTYTRNWQNSGDTDIRYAYSTNAGINWTKDQWLAWTTDVENSADISSSSYLGRFHVAFWKNYDIHYTWATVSNPTVWSLPVIVNDESWAVYISSPSVCVNPAKAEEQEACIAWTHYPLPNHGAYFDAAYRWVDICECDLNNDSDCNILDWPYFIEDWGRTDCNEPAVDCECDLNGDGSCNILDWPYFIEDWGRTDCPL